LSWLGESTVLDNVYTVQGVITIYGTRAIFVESTPKIIRNIIIATMSIRSDRMVEEFKLLIK